MHLTLLTGLAARASRRLAEDRRSGALELLASTPLGVRRLLDGEWRGIVRRFGGPLIGALSINFFVLYWAYMVIGSFEPQSVQSFLGMIWMMLQCIVPGSSENFLGEHVIGGTYIVTHLLLIPVAWYALGWTSMWLAMCVRKPFHAPLAALVLVLALPFLIWFPVSGTLDFLRWKLRWDIPASDRFSVLLFVGICLANSLLLAQWSKRTLLKNFRTWAANRYSPPAGEAALRWPWRRKQVKEERAGAQVSAQTI